MGVMKRNTVLPCDYCGRPVDTARESSALLVEGWILKRAQGGPNQVRGWRSLGKVMHGSCLDEMIMPVDTNQVALFE
jgi:hypothetical protein